MVNNITSSASQNYIPVQHTVDLKPKEIFKNLSVEMGGDGNSITKDQLNNYVAQADSNAIAVSEPKLSALKEVQSNWNKISDNKDSMTLSNLTDYTALLAMTATSTATTNTANKVANNAPINVMGVTGTTNVTDSTSATNSNSSKSVTNYTKPSDSGSSGNFNLYSYLGEATGASSSSGITKPELTSYLKTLIVGDSADSDNSNEIALLTNLIADFDALSNSKNLITPASLAASTGMMA